MEGLIEKRTKNVAVLCVYRQIRTFIGKGLCIEKRCGIIWKQIKERRGRKCSYSDMDGYGHFLINTSNI